MYHIQRRSACALTLTVLSIAATSTLVLSVAVAPRGSEIKVKASPHLPKMIALRVRHDMCPYCKALDPAFPKLVEDVAGESVLFVTVDLSDETRQSQSAMLIASLGLQSQWTGDMSKMGTIAFIDSATNKQLGFVQSSDPAEIKASLSDAMAKLKS